MRPFTLPLHTFSHAEHPHTYIQVGVKPQTVKVSGDMTDCVDTLVGFIKQRVDQSPVRTCVYMCIFANWNFDRPAFSTPFFVYVCVVL